MAAIVREAAVTVVELDRSYESLDVVGHRQAQELLLGVAATAEPPTVLLDFSSTHFFGSSFIELLFRAWKRLRERGGQLAVCRLTPFCREVLTAARLDDLWGIYETREAAVTAMQA